MGGLLHLVQRGGDWAGPAHPSTASVPITVLLYDGPLLCGFNVAIKGLNIVFMTNYTATFPTGVVGRLCVRQF